MFADMAELADALDLGSSVSRRGGSSPFTRTSKHCNFLQCLFFCQNFCLTRPIKKRGGIHIVQNNAALKKSTKKAVPASVCKNCIFVRKFYQSFSYRTQLTKAFLAALSAIVNSCFIVYTFLKNISQPIAILLKICYYIKRCIHISSI